MKAKKRLGQNFLIDEKVINTIVDNINADSKDLVIEIGPGKGAITKKIKSKKCNIVAYEIDTDLSDILDKLDINVIYKDILKSNIKEDIKNIKYNNLFIVGNLPYYITTPIIEHIIKEDLVFNKFIIMVQREVADRFMANCNTKDYGYFTLVLKYYFNISKIIDVSKYSFNPVPKVESSVLLLTRRSDKLKVDKSKYFMFLKDAFKQKRKTLKNNLKDKYDYNKIKEILDKYNFNDSVRAEELNENILVEICNNL